MNAVESSQSFPLKLWSDFIFQKWHTGGGARICLTINKIAQIWAVTTLQFNFIALQIYGYFN